VNSESQPFSELQLGVRELFRIIVPGAYAGVLFSLLPDAVLPDKILSSTGLTIAAVFFLGLAAYALRPHECWWPYSNVFWKHVDSLNNAIGMSAGPGEHTSLYKYFLTVGRRDVRDRVHYFSSFYYMLIAISMYSLVAALIETIVPAFRVALPDCGGGCIVAGAFILVALVTQLSLVFATGVHGWHSYARTWAKFVPTIAVVVATVVSVAQTIVVGTSFEGVRASWIVLLLLAAFIFANLGNKQWKAIIQEQVINVRNCSEEIGGLARGEGTLGEHGTSA